MANQLLNLEEWSELVNDFFSCHNLIRKIRNKMPFFGLFYINCTNKGHKIGLFPLQSLNPRFQVKNGLYSIDTVADVCTESS